MEKTISFKFAQKGVGQGRGLGTVNVSLSLKKKTCRNYDTMQEEEMYVFSASAAAPRLGCYGQCLSEIAYNIFENETKPATTMAEYYEIWRLWLRWHLNDMTPGTKRQMDALKDFKAETSDWYREEYQYLEKIGLLEDEGYKFGQAWLTKKISDADLNKIKEIMGYEEEA